MNVIKELWSLTEVPGFLTLKILKILIIEKDLSYKLFKHLNTKNNQITKINKPGINMDPWTQRVDYGVGFMKDMSELPVGNQITWFNKFDKEINSLTKQVPPPNYKK